MIMIRVITVTCVKKAENWIDNLTGKQLYATSEEDAEMERDHVEAKNFHNMFEPVIQKHHDDILEDVLEDKKLLR